MKTLLTILFTAVICFSSFTQTDDYPMPDSATVVAFPWYDNNQYLLDYIDQRGYNDLSWGSGSNFRTDCSTARYRIPVKMHIYLDNSGNTSKNINTSQAEQILEIANDLFTDTGIQFYIADNTRFNNDENWRTGITSFTETMSFFVQEGRSGYLNIHFIRSSSQFGAGYAVTPFYPSVPGSRWNCTVETQNPSTGNTRSIADMGTILAHELGHTLGLLHTHHPGRLPSLAFNEENATVSNTCYQELVDGNRRNRAYHFPPCFSTDGKKSCEINGDFLCDTPGDPGQSTKSNSSGTKTVTTSCVYEHGGYGNNYREDNRSDDWVPPTNNIMSYARRTCRNQFTPSQTGQMWYFIEEDFPWEFQGQFSNTNGSACSSGKSVTFTNPPSGISLDWEVQPQNLVSPLTRSGSGNTAFIRANSNNTSGWVSIEWKSSTNCNFFNESTEVWIGKPSTPYANGPSLVQPNSYHTFTATPLPGDDFTSQGISEYRWSFPLFPATGWRCYSSCSTANPVLKVGTVSTYVTLSVKNSCGWSDARDFAVTVQQDNCPPGGCIEPFSVYPNPVREELIIEPVNSEDSRSLSLSEEADLQILITNLSGEIIYRESSDKSATVRINSLKKGIYLLKILGGTINQSERIIVQ